MSENLAEAAKGAKAQGVLSSGWKALDVGYLLVCWYPEGLLLFVQSHMATAEVTGQSDLSSHPPSSNPGSP